MPGSRFSTERPSEPTEDENVRVVEERAVTIDVLGVESYTALCTPVDTLEMAAGFLLTEGVVKHATDIEEIRHCDDTADTIRVKLAADPPTAVDNGRNLLIVSSCGACGSENLDERIRALPTVGNAFSIQPDELRSVYGALRHRQVLFEATGGTHAAAVFDDTGTIVASAEDIGRHNALDKAIGKCLLGGVETAGKAVALTSRLSLEMVSKCARVGIELIAGVSAPTSLAIDVANATNLTLCAFVRETRATVFSHGERVIGTRGKLH